MLQKYFLIFFSFCTIHLIGNDITGFWQSLDKKTKKPAAVFAIYSYEGKYYGRIIGAYNQKGELEDTIYHPKNRAPGIAGNPYYSGLDIVWDAMQENGKGKYKGFVVDPQKGKVYNAELWKENGDLILRGKLLMFGRNEVWPPFPESNFNDDFKKPDLTTFVPSKPTAKAID